MACFVWLTSSALMLSAIAFDVRRLGVNRVGISIVGWGLASLAAGPAIGMVYWIQRRRTMRALIGAAWTLMGDASYPLDVRHERLKALYCSGLISRLIFRLCLEMLGREQHGVGGAVSRTN